VLRERLRHLAQEADIPCIIPSPEFSTDNAAMIGVAGLLKATGEAFANPLTLVADPHLPLV
jgi:tRNA A37 threonylcarbamoyltransferase TsaD